MVGKVVLGCNERNITLENLDEKTLGEICPESPVDALGVLKPEDSVRRREASD